MDDMYERITTVEQAQELLAKLQAGGTVYLHDSSQLSDNGSQNNRSVAPSQESTGLNGYDGYCLVTGYAVSYDNGTPMMLCLNYVGGNGIENAYLPLDESVLDDNNGGGSGSAS